MCRRHRHLVREQGKNKDEPGSCIIAPDGKVIAAAPGNDETILTASVSLEAVLRCKARLDVAGHYSRPDILKLLVNDRPMDHLIQTGDQGVDSANGFTAISAITDSRRELAPDVPPNRPQSLKSK